MSTVKEKNSLVLSSQRKKSKLNAIKPCVLAISGLIASTAMGQTQFSDLGFLGGGSFLEPAAISGNGAFFVGTGDTATSNFRNRAFIYSLATGAYSEITLPAGAADMTARGVSKFGEYVVGDAQFSGIQRAFRWARSTSSYQDLGLLNGGGFSTARAVSSDGKVVVGEAMDGASANAFRAFIWSEAAGAMTSLGTLGGVRSGAVGVSDDGSVVVGSTDLLSGESRAFRWTALGGMQSIGTLNGGNLSYGGAISADGKTIVGRAVNGLNSKSEAYIWTTSNPILISLGRFAGDDMSEAFGVSGDGRVVVGVGANSSGVKQGFRWSLPTGMQTVEQWLRDGGVSVPTQVVATAADVSSDGDIVIGRLLNGHGYIARVVPAGSAQGSGMIDIVNFGATLAGAANVSNVALSSADMVLHGAHGSPMRGLVAANQSAFWANGDVGDNGHDRFGGRLASAELGLAHSWGSNVQGNIALGRTSDNQGLELGGETRMRGNYVVPELVWKPSDGLYATFSGYYSHGKVAVRRGYWNAGVTSFSRGDAGTNVMALRARLDWLNAWKLGNADITPYTSLTATRARIEGYTESGGGFPVRWNDRTDSSTVLRAGVDAAMPATPNVTLLGRLELANRFGSSVSHATGQVLGLSGFDIAGQSQRKTWLRTGVGLEGKLGEAGTVSLMLNATTQGGAPAYWLAAGYRLSF